MNFKTFQTGHLSQTGCPEVQRLLLSLGIGMHYTGFWLLAFAIQLAWEQPGRLLAVSKSIYPDVAERFGVSWHSVERNMRTAIQASWDTDSSLLCRLAGRPLTDRPTVSQFLSLAVSCLSHDTPSENGQRSLMPKEQDGSGNFIS